MMELLSGPQEIQGLLHQIHAGDDAAWEELLRLVHDRLEKLIRVMFRGFPSLRGFIEWEDVLQNVLVRLLRALRHVGPAVPAYARQDIAPLRWVRMQSPMRPRMRLLLAAVLDELDRLLVALARRDARVVRRLGRTIQLRPQLRHLRLQRDHRRAQPLNRLSLRDGDANQFFSIERLKGVMIHPNRESEPDSRVKFAKHRRCRAEQLRWKWRRKSLESLKTASDMARR